MSFKNNTKTASRTYQVPDCDACQALTGVIICQSGEIEDWVDDGNGFQL